jgi:hypothetical protein
MNARPWVTIFEPLVESRDSARGFSLFAVSINKIIYPDMMRHLDKTVKLWITQLPQAKRLLLCLR